MTLNEVLTVLTLLSSIAAVCFTASVTWMIYKGQKKLSQRQLIIPLWEYLSNIQCIDSDHPVEKHVVNLVNTLELVAICCEGGMVDENVILRTFKDGFLMHAQSVMDIKTKMPSGKNGEAFLRENRSAYQFYLKLKDQDLKENKLN